MYKRFRAVSKEFKILGSPKTQHYLSFQKEVQSPTSALFKLDRTHSQLLAFHISC